MTPMTTPFAHKDQYEELFFAKGMYLVEVDRVKLNRRNDPFITFKVIDSESGKMVNAFKGVNFNMSSTSIKAAKLWNDKFSQLKKAVGIKDMTYLEELSAKRLVIYMSKPGTDELPNFRPEADFPKQYTPQAEHHQHVEQGVMSPTPPPYDSFMDDIPF